MATVSELNVAITADTSGLQSGLRQADQGANQLRQTMQSMASALAGLGIGAAVASVAKLGLEFLSLKEQAQIAFTTMLGSGHAAKVFLDDLAAFAARTPFEFPELIQAAQRLKAMGFEAQEVIPTLTAVGDAVAAMGGSAEMINRITVAFTQMVAKGKVSAEEMRQLAEAGIPAWEILANMLGITVPEAMKKAEKGLIDGRTAVNFLIEGIEKGTKTTQAFGGMMALQSKTVAGLFSTIKDLGRQALGDILLPAFEKLRGVMVSVVDVLPKAVQWFQSLSPEIKNGALALIAVAAAAPAVVGAISLISLALGAMMSPIGLVVAAIGALVVAYTTNLGGIRDAVNEFGVSVGVFWQEHGETLKAITINAWGVIKETIDAALQVAGTAIKITGAIMEGDWDKAMQSLVSITRKAVNAIGADLNDLWQGYKQMFTAINDADFEAGKRRFLFGEGRPVEPEIKVKALGPQVSRHDWKNVLDFEGLQKVMAEFDGTLDVGIKKTAAKVGAGKKAGGDVAKSIISGFKEGIEGLKEAFAVIESSDLGMLFEKVGKKARSGLGELKEALKIAVTAINEFAGKLTEGKITEAQFVLMDTATRRSLENMTLAYQIAHAEIGRIEVEGLTTRKQTIDITIDAYSKMSASVKQKVLDLGATFHIVFPGMDKQIGEFALGAHEASVEATAALSQNAVGTKEWGEKVTAAFEKVSEAAPHWAGAIVDAAAKVKKAIEDSAEIVRAKAQIEINDAMESVIDTFARLGEQSGKTGAELVRFVKEGLSTLSVELQQGTKKALEQFELGMFKLPGVLDEVFNKLGVKAKSFASALIGVFDTLPGRWGDSLRKAFDEVNKWINFIDAAIKLIQRILGDEQTGLGGVFAKLGTIFKKTTQDIKEATQDIGQGSEDWSERVSKGVNDAGAAVTKSGNDAIAGANKWVSAFATITGATMTFFGTRNQGKFVGILGGAGAGAMIGSMFGPIGTAIGAGVGALFGLFGSGKSSVQKEAERQAAEKLKVDMQQAAQNVINAAIEGFDKALAFFERLDEFTHVRKAKFEKFFNNFKMLMDHFLTLAKKWSADSLAKAKAAAEAIGPVAEAISALPAAFDAISGHFGIAQSSIDRFFDDFSRLMDAFFAKSEIWIDGVSKRAMKVANRLSPVVALISAFGTALSDISDVKEPADEMFAIFDRVIDKIVTHVANLSLKFDKAVLKTMANFAEKAGAALSIWKEAIESIKATVDIQAPSEQSVDNVVAGIELFINKLGGAVERLITTDLARITAFANTIAPIAAAIKAWAETAEVVRGYTAIAAEVWDQIVADFERGLVLLNLLILDAQLYVEKATTFKTLIDQGTSLIDAALRSFGSGISAAASALTGGLPSGGTSMTASAASTLAPMSASQSASTTVVRPVVHVHVSNMIAHTQVPEFVERAIMDLYRSGRVSGSVFTGLAPAR